MSRHHSRALRYFGLAVFLVALCAAAPVFAQTVGVHLVSKHEPQTGYSNDNPGAYVRVDGVQVGIYRNSIRRTSVYVTRAWEAGPFAVAAGLVTGYDLRGSPVAPLVSASVALPAVAGVTPRLTYVPRAAGFGAHVLHLSIERGF